MQNYKVTVLGAGLAGCEAALWLAGKGVEVTLYEQKPTHFSPAHKSEGFAELICSNSLKAERLDSASGLLKEEMRRMGSQLLPAAADRAVQIDPILIFRSHPPCRADGGIAVFHPLIHPSFCSCWIRLCSC